MRTLCNIPLVFLLLGGFMSFQGCATVLGGRTNSFIFQAGSVPAAEIYLDSAYIGQAPGKIKLEKEKIQHGSILEIRAEGYESQEYLILRKQHPLYTIADTFTGVIWLGVDYATGDIYRPHPRKFNYVLKSNTQ